MTTEQMDWVDDHRPAAPQPHGGDIVPGARKIPAADRPRRSWSRLIVAAAASALAVTMMLVAWSLGRLTAPHPVVEPVDAERVCVILDHGAGEHAPTEVTCWPEIDGQVQP